MCTHKGRVFRVFTLGFVVVATGLAQDSATPAPPPALSPKSYLGSIKYYGLLDAHYVRSYNHPASRVNQLHNFAVRANHFYLSYAEFAMEHDASPIGFRFDVGVGRTTKLVYGAEQAGEAFRYIQQVYLSLIPPGAKGLQIDAGKFVTSAGAEVIEATGNWNYSRSLLFAWAIPYYHLGIRTSMPLHKNYTAGVQVLNGWNNVKDINSGKTLGLTGTLTKGKVTWFHNYLVGPEKAHTNEGFRHLFDTTVLVNPNSKTSFYVNFDFGRDERIGGGADQWVGVAGAARYQVNKWFALAPRLEWFDDRDGFSTGTPQTLKEFTMTGELRLPAEMPILARVEYRRDWSDVPFFERASGLSPVKNQDTLLVGLLFTFEKK